MSENENMKQENAEEGKDGKTMTAIGSNKTMAKNVRRAKSRTRRVPIEEAFSAAEPEVKEVFRKRPARGQERVPLGKRDVMTVKGLDHNNFHYRWVNDIGDRLVRAVDGGYAFVPAKGNEVGDHRLDYAQKPGANISKGVGNDVTAYLMQIPKELYLEDQAEKQKRGPDAYEKAMKPDKTKGQNGPGVTYE